MFVMLFASESKASQVFKNCSQISKNCKLENLWRNLEPLQPHLPRKKFLVRICQMGPKPDLA